tara:strand:+ start:32827 stop:34980 length:2154 start_codon:yes stop_codon:yes gene_type:complete
MKKSSNSNIMKESSVADLMQEFNFFIPEIQREYVWGNNQRDILSAFCKDIIQSKKTSVNAEWLQKKITSLTANRKFDEIQQLLLDSENGSPINIGFLYSYDPNYNMDQYQTHNDAYNDAYLIDGQQRFTTLFLMLFYLSLLEDKRSDFAEYFRYNIEKSTIAFDYRVRSLTHDFVLQLMDKVESKEQINEIEDSVWYVNEFDNDVTIASMINALKIIQKEFENEETGYFDFILYQIKFWHFKTEKTNQGEELYITMNSRGKQLEENETVRAKLFEGLTPDEQIRWSIEWENWQDFFWKNREDSDNADDGFNEFLICISGLQSYLNEKDDFVESKADIFDKHLLSNLSLEIIESYINSLEYLIKHQESFQENYEDASWVTKAITQIKVFIFNGSINWFVDYEHPNKATERMRMVFIWSVLEFIKQKSQEDDNIKDIYRFLRIYWLRFNNHDRGVSLLKERVNKQLKGGVWSQTNTKDEELRHTFYLRQESENVLCNYEEHIWKIEDHELNLNGYQVENINSSHLIDFEKLNSIDDLKTIYYKFNNLFSKNKPKDKLLSDILMFYGFYGMRRTPYYYHNYDFSSWRRIIRDFDSNSNCFKKFFSDYDGENLKEIFVQKKSNFLLKNKDTVEDAKDILKCDKLVNCIRFYILVSNNIWVKGGSIAYEDYEVDDILTTFEQHHTLFNTKGTFRGYGYARFTSVLPDKPILKLKKQLKMLKI